VHLLVQPRLPRARPLPLRRLPLNIQHRQVCLPFEHMGLDGLLQYQIRPDQCRGIDTIMTQRLLDALEIEGLGADEGKKLNELLRFIVSILLILWKVALDQQRWEAEVTYDLRRTYGSRSLHKPPVETEEGVRPYDDA
jgi:hypothetical protein